MNAMDFQPIPLAFDLQATVVELAGALGATLRIFFLTLVFSLPLGLLVAFGRMSKFTPLRLVTKFFISILRGTPLMLQLVVVFFAPYYVFGISLSNEYRFWAVIIGFTINYAAYFAEIYRGGIESIPKGQYEAASVLGFSKTQTFLRIIFPQVMKVILPSVTNEIITLVKDTSLAFSIAYLEMFSMARQLVSTQSSIAPLFVAGGFYYIMNLLVAFLMERVEKKLSYYS
ncbi:MAG: amino acid ABC transporter permease [Clostridiales bacterium]|nr:amino acid ABC transporter permease [Clostridiales bacterium]